MNRLFLIAVLVLGAIAPAVAVAEKPADVEIACRAVLTENMQAIVHEDVAALLGTMSRDCGTPAQFDEFQRQAEEMFAATDVYMHVAGFKLYAYNPPYAEAWVLQQTMPKNAEDHYPVEAGQLNFRHHSALLPEHKLVAYKQRFHKVRGEWKVHKVLSQPHPVDEATLAQLNGQRAPAKSTCPDGKCSSPFVRVR